MFETFKKVKEPEPFEERIRRLKAALQDADAVVIGAGVAFRFLQAYNKRN